MKQQIYGGNYPWRYNPARNGKNVHERENAASLILIRPLDLISPPIHRTRDNPFAR